MKAHFVTFYSPGTFFSEQSERTIDSWDATKAQEMASGIKERYGATPYGFQFTTRERKANELDSKEVERSGTYFLGGRLMTLEDVEREMPDERILIGNMRGNKIERVCVNDNDWRSIHPFTAKDVLLEASVPSSDAGQKTEKTKGINEPS